MTTNQFTILSELPKFTGNPTLGEPSFKSEVDARTFLRSLENYFLNNEITDDAKKVSVLYSLIDKREGDAIRFITCYQGQKVTFDELKRDFLEMYPSFTVTDFRSAG